MPELRQDPLIGHWVIVSPERGMRPVQPAAELPQATRFDCPFCPGNEAMTPPAVYCFPAGGRWQVRVVPNKFPALTATPAPPAPGPFEHLPGLGAHEVVIESPHHELELGDQPIPHVTRILQSCALRIQTLYRDKQHAYVQLFKNVGPQAGASLSHPHLQLVAMPVVPETLRRELQRLADHASKDQESLVESVLRREIRADVRTVTVTNEFVVLAPYASRMPFELGIIPRFPSPDFTALSETHQASLSALLKRTLACLKSVLGEFPYNMVLHTCPNPQAEPLEQLRLADYRWRMELLPRLTKAAGLEWGSGLFVNPVPPEHATRLLRQAQSGIID